MKNQVGNGTMKELGMAGGGVERREVCVVVVCGREAYRQW